MHTFAVNINVSQWESWCNIASWSLGLVSRFLADSLYDGTTQLAAHNEISSGRKLHRKTRLFRFL